VGRKTKTQLIYHSVSHTCRLRCLCSLCFVCIISGVKQC